MRVRAGVLAMAAVLATASPGAAQMPQAGARSLQLSPVGDTQVGLWRMLSERTNAGLEVGLSLGGSEEGENGTAERSVWTVSLSPSLKRYTSPVGPLAPYLFGSVPLSVRRFSVELSDIDETTLGVGGVVGVGLDWFPARNLSLGGHVGVRAAYATSSREAPDVADFETSTTEFGTLGSGLVLHLYF